MISGKTVEDQDRIQEGQTIGNSDSVPHMLNFLECMRTRKEPNAPIEAGYSHSVAAILADESFVRGSRVVYDEGKRKIREG